MTPRGVVYVILFFFVIKAVEYQTTKNPCTLLGVVPPATNAQVRSAFRRKSPMFHPDKFTDSAQKKRAEEFFIELSNAKELLMEQPDSCAVMDWTSIYSSPIHRALPISIESVVTSVTRNLPGLETFSVQSVMDTFGSFTDPKPAKKKKGKKRQKDGGSWLGTAYAIGILGGASYVIPKFGLAAWRDVKASASSFYDYFQETKRVGWFSGENKINYRHWQNFPKKEYTLTLERMRQISLDLMFQWSWDRISWFMVVVILRFTQWGGGLTSLFIVTMLYRVLGKFKIMVRKFLWQQVTFEMIEVAIMTMGYFIPDDLKVDTCFLLAIFGARYNQGRRHFRIFSSTEMAKNKWRELRNPGEIGFDYTPLSLSLIAGSSLNILVTSVQWQFNDVAFLNDMFSYSWPAWVQVLQLAFVPLVVFGTLQWAQRGREGYGISWAYVVLNSVLMVGGLATIFVCLLVPPSPIGDRSSTVIIGLCACILELIIALPEADLAGKVPEPNELLDKAEEGPTAPADKVADAPEIDGAEKPADTKKAPNKKKKKTKKKKSSKDSSPQNAGADAEDEDEDEETDSEVDSDEEDEEKKKEEPSFDIQQTVIMLFCQIFEMIVNGAPMGHIGDYFIDGNECFSLCMFGAVAGWCGVLWFIWEIAIGKFGISFGFHPRTTMFMFYGAWVLVLVSAWFLCGSACSAPAAPPKARRRRRAS